VRHYNSFFIQTWVDDGPEAERKYRLKVEHVQTGVVVVLTDPGELPAWLRQQWVESSALAPLSSESAG
jgi:hypothetical protein